MEMEMEKGMGDHVADEMTSWERWQRTCTFAKNYSYYCRQSSLPTTTTLWKTQNSRPTRRDCGCIGNLIQLPVGWHINPALYCIRSTQGDAILMS